MSTTTSTHAATQLLMAWNGGDASAAPRLMPLVYDELRRVARGYLRGEREGHTLQPTALVHEAYLRMVDTTQVAWQGRAHFLALAARAMRRILVEHARAHGAAKRGGLAQRVPLDAADGVAQGEGPDLVALDGALQELARTFPRQSEVVELKFFGGLEAREMAEVLGVSEKTVLRDWSFARLWLQRELDGQPVLPHAP